MLLQIACSRSAHSRPPFSFPSHECDSPGTGHLPALTSANITWTNSDDVDRQVSALLMLPRSAAGHCASHRCSTAPRSGRHWRQARAYIRWTQRSWQACGLMLSSHRVSAASAVWTSAWWAAACPLACPSVGRQSHPSPARQRPWQVERIAAGITPPPRIIDLNPHGLEDVLADIERVGEALGLAPAGREAVDMLRARVAAAQRAADEALAAAGGRRPRVAFIEWTKPIFPGGHWTPQLIVMAGGEHTINPPLRHAGMDLFGLRDPSRVS